MSDRPGGGGDSIEAMAGCRGDGIFVFACSFEGGAPGDGESADQRAAEDTLISRVLTPNGED